MLQCAALFFTDNGLIASTDPDWLQGAFETLIGLFNRMGLRTNVGKTVRMICLPCHVVGNNSEVAYEWWMKG